MLSGGNNISPPGHSLYGEIKTRIKYFLPSNTRSFGHFTIMLLLDDINFNKLAMYIPCQIVNILIFSILILGLKAIDR